MNDDKYEEMNDAHLDHIDTEKENIGDSNPVQVSNEPDSYESVTSTPISEASISDEPVSSEAPTDEPVSSEPVSMDQNHNINNNTMTSDTTPTQNTSVYNTQRFWQAQNLQNNDNNQAFNGPNANNYYKESYKKTNKKSNAWKYILVSIVSSLVGGAFIAIMLLVVAPVIQPQLRDFVQELFPNSKLESVVPTPGEYKRVEIVQSEESAITSVAEKVGPSVVGIRTTYQNSNALFGIQEEGGEGSGIIYSTDGYIITNHHVVEGAINDKTRTIRNDAKIEVYLPSRIDKPYVATLKGYDSKTDLAVLKINETNLPAIELGNSDELKVGEVAVAIGNPGGLEYMGSVTSGVVSGLNRTVQLEGGKKIKLVQTDAAINPGNSGGALVNLRGQLIGVNTVKMVATGFEGLGFAIPVNDVKTIADELVKNTYISKPYLGVSIDQRYTEELAKANNMPAGVYVADTEMLGAAQKAGIMPGDVITKFNNKAIKTFDELEAEKNKFKPGDTVPIEVYRDGETKKFNVKLDETK